MRQKKADTYAKELREKIEKKYGKYDDALDEWVTSASLCNMQSYIDAYNQDPCEDNFMVMISNCPMGLQLFERCSTNYKQLQTIYHLRHNHKLPEWREFCDWILTLPWAKELILGE